MGSWTASPVCDWSRSLPKRLHDLALRAVRGKAAGEADVINVDLGPKCMYKRWIKCAGRPDGDVSDKELVVVSSCTFFANVLLENPHFAVRLRAAFERRLPSGDKRLEFMGPLARWLYAPSAPLKKEIDDYVEANLRGNGKVSICISGRAGDKAELERIASCITGLRASPWWPKNRTTAFHVSTVRGAFRTMVRKRYAADEVYWLRQRVALSTGTTNSSVTSFKEMLTFGRCHIAVIENGGSTFSYLPTGMYHSVALRDAGGHHRGSLNCRDILSLPYSKLFPDARSHLSKKCVGGRGVLRLPCGSKTSRDDSPT